MLAKKTSKNQITLPKEIAKEFPNTDYFDVDIKNKRIVLTPVEIKPLDNSLDDIRNKIQKLGITELDLEKAVKWARKKTE
ncbi:MAG: AbrB/MazE/SpoVT family DNA-binding domain-containing protein [Thermodesulfobacteriota bacterium]